MLILASGDDACGNLPIMTLRLRVSTLDLALSFSPHSRQQFHVSQSSSKLDGIFSLEVTLDVHVSRSSTYENFLKWPRYSMERRPKRRIKTADLPPTGNRRCVRIYAKVSRKMLPSSSSPLSRKGDKAPRSNLLSRQPSPFEEPPELSDVPCYTCRRRHVKCDRILPTWYVWPIRCQLCSH